MNALDQIDAIKSEARENLIRKIHKNMKPSKPSFASAIHAIAEKEDKEVNLAQSVDFAIDTHLESDLASENLAEMFG